MLRIQIAVEPVSDVNYRPKTLRTQGEWNEPENSVVKRRNLFERCKNLLSPFLFCSIAFVFGTACLLHPSRVSKMVIRVFNSLILLAIVFATFSNIADGWRMWRLRTTPGSETSVDYVNTTVGFLYLRSVGVILYSLITDCHARVDCRKFLSKQIIGTY